LRAIGMFCTLPAGMVFDGTADTQCCVLLAWSARGLPGQTRRRLVHAWRWRHLSVTFCGRSLTTTALCWKWVPNFYCDPAPSTSDGARRPADFGCGHFKVACYWHALHVPFVDMLADTPMGRPSSCTAASGDACIPSDVAARLVGMVFVCISDTSVLRAISMFCTRTSRTNSLTPPGVVVLYGRVWGCLHPFGRGCETSWRVLRRHPSDTSVLRATGMFCTRSSWPSSPALPGEDPFLVRLPHGQRCEHTARLLGVHLVLHAALMDNFADTSIGAHRGDPQVHSHRRVHHPRNIALRANWRARHAALLDHFADMSIWRVLRSPSGTIWPTSPPSTQHLCCALIKRVLHEALMDNSADKPCWRVLRRPS
jgi:hypothetical protein